MSTMTAEKVRAFENYNWTDPRWLAKVKSYDVPLTIKQMPRVKRKWYRDNIDKDFDIDADFEAILKNEGATGSENNNQQTNGSSQHQQNYSRAQPSPGPARDYSKDKKFLMEGFLKVIFLIITFVNIPFPYSKMITLGIGVAVCV